MMGNGFQQKTTELSLKELTMSNVQDLLKKAIKIAGFSATDQSVLVKWLLNHNPEAFVQLVLETETFVTLKGEPLAANSFLDFSIVTAYPDLNASIRRHQNELGGVSKDDWITMTDLINSKNRVEAIKTLRSVTGMGLKEAKDIVDYFDVLISTKMLKL